MESARRVSDIPWEAQIRFVLAQYTLQWATQCRKEPGEAVAFCRMLIKEVLGTQSEQAEGRTIQ